MRLASSSSTRRWRKQFWPKSSPLGERLIIGRGIMREFAAEPERQIIGVVGDTRDDGLNNDPGPTMFIPQSQVPDLANALNVRITPMAWVVRTETDPLFAELGDPGTAATGDGVARHRRAVDDGGRFAVDVARALQHVADDGVRRCRRCCSRRLVSTA